jgi:uncharacterized protein (DUF2252 family)
MLSMDPIRLARRQLEIDRERTSRFDLFDQKVARMTASPLAFLRGSAPLFYELLERHPPLSDGPGGEGWVVGDAHLENFGAFRAGALSLRDSRRTRDNERVVFDLNDFDEALVGPWRFDVVRLITSLVLGGRELGASGPSTLELCDALVSAYVDAVFHLRRPTSLPAPIASLIDKVRARTRQQLLDARTHLVRGERRFVLGPRYRPLPKKLRAKVERAFARYTKGLPEAERSPDRALEVIDAAFRVAGNGSLGSLRVAVLVRGKGGTNGAWIFDMKEESTPAAASLVRKLERGQRADVNLGSRPPRLKPAERVCAANHACLAQPPRMIGSTRLRGLSMLVRRLAPQEDKLDLGKLRSEDLPALARHLGALLGAAHRRGVKRLPKKPWSNENRARLLGNAIALAGVHEATYLAYCELTRR